MLRMAMLKTGSSGKNSLLSFHTTRTSWKTKILKGDTQTDGFRGKGVPLFN
jgi:hypothetical protein